MAAWYFFKAEINTDFNVSKVIVEFHHVKIIHREYRWEHFQGCISLKFIRLLGTHSKFQQFGVVGLELKNSLEAETSYSMNYRHLLPVGLRNFIYQLYLSSSAFVCRDGTVEKFNVIVQYVFDFDHKEGW